MSAAVGASLIGMFLPSTRWTSVTRGFPSTTSTQVGGENCSWVVLHGSLTSSCARIIRIGEYVLTRFSSSGVADAAAAPEAAISETDAIPARQIANLAGRRMPTNLTRLVDAHLRVFPRNPGARTSGSVVGLSPLYADAEADLIADHGRVQLLVVEHDRGGRLDGDRDLVALDDLIVGWRCLDHRDHEARVGTRTVGVSLLRADAKHRPGWDVGRIKDLAYRM